MFVLAELVPWDELTEIYPRNIKHKAGRINVDIWMVIGALIIIHKLSLSDRDTLEMISENMYMRYFYGLRSFQTELPFDTLLFVDIRKRINKGDGEDRNQKGKSSRRGSLSFKTKGQKEDISNQGKLKLDASIADQYITTPNDLKLVNRARVETERLVDALIRKEALIRNLGPTVAMPERST